MPTSMVGVNTMVPNILVKTAIEAGLVKQLKGYATTRSEVKTGPGTRLDIVLEDNRLGLCFIEIKNCTLVEEGIASFPDAVTSRGLKHLEELAALVKQGHRGVIFYLVQRSDASLFRPADSIDPEYGKALRKVIKSGVEILVYDVKINQTRIDLNKQIPIKL